MTIDINPIEITIGSRIKVARLAKDLTQKEFAASLGIVQGFLSGIERGKKAPSDTLLIALCHFYRINEEWLFTGTGNIFRETSSGDGRETFASTKTPVLKRIPEGFPEKVTAEDIHDYISLPNVPEGCYALVTYGDFMAPTIRDGDLVIFAPDGEIINGAIVLVNNRWGEPILRRYRIKDNAVYLTPDNLAYAPFNPDPDTRTIGAVVEVWRKIKI